MFKTKLKLFISLFLITTMDWNVKEGNIERNKFIADSIKNHIDYVTIGPGGDNTSPTVELEVLIPILLALKLWWKALITQTSISNIVNEALAFLVSLLLEQNQAQENLRLEVELSSNFAKFSLVPNPIIVANASFLQEIIIK